MFITPSSSPRRRQWQPTPVLLPGKSHGRRGLVGYSPWGRKELTWLNDFTFTFHFHALEKEMATHSSVLAWRIPGTGEPGGLLSMGVAQSQTWLKRLSSSSSSSSPELSLSPLPSLISSSAFPIKIYGKPDRRILRIKPCLDSSNEGIFQYIGLLMQFSNNTFLKQRGCFGTYFVLLSRPLCNLFP